VSEALLGIGIAPNEAQGEGEAEKLKFADGTQWVYWNPEAWVVGGPWRLEITKIRRVKAGRSSQRLTGAKPYLV